MKRSEELAAEAERVARGAEELKAQGKKFHAKLMWAASLAKEALAELEKEKRVDD